MIDPVTQYILNEMKRPNVLYHASDTLTKTLKPRITNISVPTAHSLHGKNAIFASHNKLYAFGLERVNMMVVNKYTEKEVEKWTKACWLKPHPPKLFVYYWNHIPRKPIYLYTVSSKGFKPFKVTTPKHTTYHWYITKDITPLKVQKLTPQQVKKDSWKIVSDKEWEEKKQKYKDRGFYK